MPEIEPLEFTIDDAVLQRAVKASNASVDGLRDNVVKSNGAMESAWERQMRTMEKMSRSVESYGSASERVLKGMAAGVRGATEFAGAMFLGAKAIAAQTTASGALEAAWNRVRAARIGIAAFTEGIGGAAVVGTEIAAVIAVEKIAKATYERSREIQSQALAAQRTGFTYEDRSALDFTAQRAGRPPDYYDSAVKSAGGVDQLAKRLRELADVRDPLVRAELAFKEFGPDAEKALASLGDRFGDNLDRAKQWGIGLDDVTRTRVDSFRRDIDGIGASFDSVGDSVAATKRQLVSLLELDFASVWQIGKAIATDEGGRAAYKQLFTEPDPKEVLKGAQREIQRRSSENVTDLNVLETLRSLRPAAEKSFQSDFFAKDQEADLRADIADLRKKLFVSDRTSPNFGKLVSGASFETGYGGLAESVQKLTSDQNQLARVLEHKKELKDADEAARKAAQELAAAQRTVAAGLESAQLAELSGADRLRAQRDHAIAQYGKTRDLVRDINKEFDIRFGIEGKAIIDQSAADMRTRAAAEARSQESQLNARTKYTSDAVLGLIRISGEAPAKRDEIDRQGADLQRESQLRQLESFGAKTLAQKAAVEAAKFQIESSYFTRVQEIESRGIDRGYQAQIQSLKVLVDAKLISEKAFNDQKSALDQNEALDLIKLHERTDAEIERSGIAAARAVREEYQRGFQEIKGEASGLLSTLFTNPSAFGKQLFETVRAAVLRPIIDGLSDTIAGALHPIIYGGQGGGMAGALKSLSGGAQDPLRISSEALKGSTDVNTGATDRNTDELRRLGEALERQGSSGGSSTSSGGGFFASIPSFARSAALGLAGFAGFGGLAMPAFPGTQTFSPRVMSSVGFERKPIEEAKTAIQFIDPGASARDQERQIQQVVESATPGFSSAVGYQTSPLGSSPFTDNPAGALGIGGTAGFAGGFGGFGGATSAGGGGFLSAIPKLFGSGTQNQSGGAFGGFRNIAANFKDINWGGFTRQGQGIPGVDGQEGTDTGGSGKITGVNGLAGAGLQAGGMYLAQRGLLGQDRGTTKGIFEGAAGGAAIGFQMGGPIGAAVGAAVGAGIGLGEKLAGVESPENKAIRIVKEAYRIDINRQLAQQIVQIADSKYAKNVNLAVRSPEVRQMLELYSAGTGQAGRMPLSSTTPTGASLIEQGGRLYQGQQYRFGNAYVQQSSLPVAGGGSPGVYPNPSPTYVSLHFDGKNAGDAMTGQFVTPTFVQAQFARSQQASDGRLQNSAMVQAPGLVFG